MANSSLIPRLDDSFVLDEIIPRLPWHTRPLLVALNSAWGNALEAIGVQGGNRLHPINGESTARKTRLKQPLQCRLAVEYYPVTYPKSDFTAGYVVKLFDGEWRNVAPVRGQGPYTYTGEGPYRGNILGVVDGTLYFFEVEHSLVRTIRLFALDVGSGLWQWMLVFERENAEVNVEGICRSGRVAGHRFLYSSYYRNNVLVFNITEIPGWLQRTDGAPKKDSFSQLFSPQPMFAHVEDRLYFFGEGSFRHHGFVHDTERVSFLDLDTAAWDYDSRDVVSAFEFMGSVNVEKNVLLVAYSGEYFHILRYNSENECWIRAGRVLEPPDHRIWMWTWCVEYDEDGETQLWIYNCSDRNAKLESSNVSKWQVVHRDVVGKVWDDILLPAYEIECELDNCTELGHPIQLLEDLNISDNCLTLFVRSFHAFHRSDLTNFEDITHHNLPIVSSPSYSECVTE